MKSDHKETTPEVAMQKAGYDSIEEVQKEALFGSRAGIPACCTCRAIIEPDGECEHGNPSILRKKGLI